MKKILTLTALLFFVHTAYAQPSEGSENASTSTEQTSTTTSSTTNDQDFGLISTSTEEISSEELNATSTQSVEEKREIATKIVIQVEQILPVFEAYINRVDLINQKIIQKSTGLVLGSESNFYIKMDESQVLKNEAASKIGETRELISKLNESDLEEILVSIRSNVNLIKTNIILSNESSKEAISYLKTDTKQ